MEQKDKDLLLQDLCARLPYKVKASYYGAEEECECWDEVEGIVNDYVEIGQYSLPIEAVKPYLFPLSSMTEEQKREYEDALTYHDYVEGGWTIAKSFYDEYIIPYWFVDFCNKNHFDYRGLIAKGLSNDATGLNIY